MPQPLLQGQQIIGAGGRVHVSQTIQCA
jgi:hypothetical protein